MQAMLKNPHELNLKKIRAEERKAFDRVFQELPLVIEGENGKKPG